MKTEQNDGLPLLGLALRAGRLVVGDDAVRDEIRRKNVRLLLLTTDAGERSRQGAERLSTQGDCLLLTLPCDREALGKALGRASAAIAALTDVGFAHALARRLAAADPEQYAETAARLEVKEKRIRERRAARQTEAKQRKAESREQRPPAKARSRSSENPRGTESQRASGKRKPFGKAQGKPPVYAGAHRPKEGTFRKGNGKGKDRSRQRNGENGSGNGFQSGRPENRSGRGYKFGRPGDGSGRGFGHSGPDGGSGRSFKSGRPGDGSGRGFKSKRPKTGERFYAKPNSKWEGKRPPDQREARKHTPGSKRDGQREKPRYADGPPKGGFHTSPSARRTDQTAAWKGRAGKRPQKRNTNTVSRPRGRPVKRETRS